MQVIVAPNKRIVPVILLALAGMIVLLIGTPWGIGLSPDSISYIGAAQNLLAGKGLTVPYGAALNGPMTHHAPFYSLVLALPGLLGLDPLASARWLNAFLFAANVLLMGMIIEYYGRRTSWTAAAAGLLFLTSVSMLTLHLMAWTEPLFQFLGILGLFFIAAYLDNGRWRYLILSAIFISLALLTRYAGITLVMTGGLAVLFWARPSWRKQLLPALTFGFLSVLPLLIWLLRNFSEAGTATNRDVAFHPLGMTQIRQAIDTFSSWLLIPLSAPLSIKTGVPVVLLGVLGTAVYLRFRERANPRDRRFWAGIVTQTPTFLKILIIFIPVYLAFLAFSISFLDANTPLDNRILSPVFMAGLILLAFVVNTLLHHAHAPRRSEIVLAGIGIVFVGFQLLQSYTLLAQSYREGIGFNNRLWHDSQVLQQVRALPPDTPIYANSPEGVYIHTERPCYPIPKTINAASQQANDQFQAELQAMQQQLQAGNGVVIYFNSLNISSIPTAEALSAALSLQLSYQGSDGAIYTLETTN
ncbi:MAG: glycosyltransferase family 39 protein [Ardenticatenaceae bacterium]|nr:glycosyltransferase family 39 protein [Anaerolineales bacterium]MCB8923684.1 glycosyltransferase family 39 protein [Ardenticatenaceae bacterium]